MFSTKNKPMEEIESLRVFRSSAGETQKQVKRESSPQASALRAVFTCSVTMNGLLWR
jgi:hypothetical protein